MAEFRFDPIEHKYYLDDKPLTNPSTLFREEGAVDTTFYTEEGRDNGSRRHLIFHLDDIDDLDEDSVDPVDLPYLEVYRRFKRENNFVLIASETPVFNATYMIACTPDKLCTMNGKKALTEIKTGNLEPWTALQTAFQSLCIPDPVERYGLKIDEKNYRLFPYKDRTDRNIVLSCLAWNRWKKNNLKCLSQKMMGEKTI